VKDKGGAWMEAKGKGRRVRDKQGDGGKKMEGWEREEGDREGLPPLEWRSGYAPDSRTEKADHSVAYYPYITCLLCSLSCWLHVHSVSERLLQSGDS